MSDVTVYAGCALFDGTADEPVPDGALAVRDGRVEAVGPRARVLDAAGPAAEQVDLSGRFVVPGLIDAHVHLHFPSRGPGELPLALVEYPEYSTIKAVYNAQVYLAAGVTSVMDCGTRGNIAVALREAIDRGLAIGPRVVASGIPLSPTAGWADEHAPFVESACPSGQTVDTADEWVKAIRAQVKQGVDNIKIGISGSSVTPYSDPHASDMSREQIALVVAEAHRAGCSVAAHCHAARGFVDAVRAGVDTIHHGFSMDERGIEALVEHPDTYFVPTAIKTYSLVTDGPKYGRRPASGSTLAAGLDRYLKVLRQVVEAGLADRIAVGSDAGNLPPEHGSTAREVEILVSCGMRPAQAVRSATRVAAEAIGLADEVGTLEPGKRADFVVLDGDPLQDVTLLADRRRFVGVYKDGRRVAERGALTAGFDLSVPCPNDPVYGRRPRMQHSRWR